MARVRGESSGSRRMMMAAVMLGALAGTPAARASPPPQVVTDISKYCQACWRNARLPADRWDDCTHEVFVRLLERLGADRWMNVLEGEDTLERREFLRAIDTVRKRVQRERKLHTLPADLSVSIPATFPQEEREFLTQQVLNLLTPRQQRVLQLVADGWKVPDIARELGTTPARISDEKYKAIKKLQHHLDT
jgi:RNA polymerase sigma factor (sigma-70 family)